ncbi:MAG: hypothetical protein ABIZ52_04405 [Candidatus Limnocylindrales bacterium]
MRSDGSRPTRLTRLGGLVLAGVAFAILLGAAPPSVVVPGTILRLRDPATQGNGGPADLDPLVPILIAVFAIVVIAVLGAAFVLLRTRGAKAVPPMSEGWWTCAKCGAGNMDGAARCHSCATWRTSTSQPTAPQPTTSATP